MRIKFDYVTNSSSTSFTGYGIKLKVIPERLWHPVYEYYKKSDRFDDKCFEEFILEGYLNETFDDFISDHGLVLRYCRETGELFLGLYARGKYDPETRKCVYEECSKDIDVIKQIFESIYQEIGSTVFVELCDEIEFIDKTWYE